MAQSLPRLKHLVIFGDFLKNEKMRIMTPKSTLFRKKVVFQFSRFYFGKYQTIDDFNVLRGKFPTFWYKNHASKSIFEELMAP